MLFILLSIVDLLLIWNFLEIDLIKPGVLIGLFLIVYLAVQHLIRGNNRRFFPKELIIITVYTSAIWYLPVLRSGNFDTISTYVMVIHLLLVTQNVLIFSYFERDEDRASDKLSIFTEVPDQQLKYIMFISNIANFVVIAWQTIFADFQFYIFIPASINLIYLLELSFLNNREVKQNYETITDAAMLLFLANFIS